MKDGRKYACITAECKYVKKDGICEWSGRNISNISECFINSFTFTIKRQNVFK